MKIADLIRSNPAVLEVNDERNSGDGFGSGDGIWVYLNQGFVEPLNGIHMIHEDTYRECASLLDTVIVCNCNDYCKG